MLRLTSEDTDGRKNLLAAFTRKKNKATRRSRRLAVHGVCVLMSYRNEHLLTVSNMLSSSPSRI